jgi:hypothetical protein
VYWTDDEINNWLNQSYFYYYQWIMQSFQGYFLKDTLMDINAGQDKYTVPADFFKIRLLERILPTQTVPMRVFDRMESPNVTTGANYGNFAVPTYRFEGEYIVLEPTPDSTFTSTDLITPVAVVAGSTTTITVGGAPWAVNQWQNKFAEFTTLPNQAFRITSNTANTLTVTDMGFDPTGLTLRVVTPGGMRLEYYKIPTPMASDSDTLDPGYLVVWEEPLVLRAVISAKQKEEAVANTGTDLAPLWKQVQEYEQNIKEAAHQRTTNRRYTEVYGPDDYGL